MCMGQLNRGLPWKWSHVNKYHCTLHAADGAEKIVSKSSVLWICLDVEIALFGPRDLCFVHIMYCCSRIIGR